MRIFRAPNNDRMIIIIGVGLIGSEISKLFLKEKIYQVSEFKIDWKNLDFFRNDFQNIYAYLIKEGVNKVDIVWAAGKAGFSSSFEQCESEAQHFFNFVDTVAYFKRSSFTTIIHFISSAGGLFEGNTWVNANTIPTPKRPYGAFKIKKEEYLKKKLVGGYKIYRPSSVFGKISKGKRAGLIGVLLENLKQNKETQLFGSQDTLRDFIFVEDVARSIFRVINFTEYFHENTFFLVSGRSASIFEIVYFIKKLSGKKVLFRFIPTSDSLSMSFSPNLNPFEVRNFEYGIRKLMSES